MSHPGKIIQKISWSGMTHPGRFRKNNEDSFLALNFDAKEVRHLGKIGEGSLEECDYVFAVSDGMGGANSGEFASRIAVEKITKLLPKSFAFSSWKIDMGFHDVLGELFNRIHEEMLMMGQNYEECAGMGATLSLGWFTPGKMYFSHIGDSRIYHVPPADKMIQLTHDHSHVGYLRRKGELNERGQRNHPRGSILNQSLGAGHQYLDPHIGVVDTKAGDTFVFCTDGIVDGLWDHALEDMARMPAGADSYLTIAQRLVETAVSESGKDNATAVVVQIA